jgi:hypothetical protein
MTQPSLLIVTVNWNAGAQLADCVRSFIIASKHISAHMVVVDNDSQDGSDQVVEKFAADGYPISLVRAGNNLGFAKGCNLGVLRAREAGHASDFILFLNPDTRLEAESLVHLFEAECTRDPEIGIIGVQLTDGFHIAHSCSYFPTALNFWCKNTGLNNVLTKKAWAQHHMRDFDHLKSREVDQVMGAFFLIRGSLFDRLEGFDPQFFVYFEEVDLCLRAKQAGYKVWFEASSRVWHHGGGTTENVKGFRLYLSLSSRLRYFAKNRPRLSYASVVILSFIVEPIARAVRLILRGHSIELKEVGKGYLMILRNGLK